MLSIFPQRFPGLGQAAEQKLYRETGNCGTVTGGGFFAPDAQAPCRRWTASEIPSSTPVTIFAVDLGREITYYPTPQSVVDKLGRCQALWTGYSEGFLVPTAQGTERVEPGLFHPSKSWQEMIDESRKLRANDPSVQASYFACAETAIPLAQVFPTQLQSTTLTLRNADGSTKCQAPELSDASGIVASWTARLPANYQRSIPVLRTAAMWLSSDSSSWTDTRGVPGGPATLSSTPDKTRPVGPFTEQMICGSQPVTSQGSLWGHSYDVQTATVVQFDGSGAGDVVQRRLEGPIVQVYVNPNAGPATSIAATWTGLWTGGITGNIYAGLLVGYTVGALVGAATEGQWVNLTPSQVQRALAAGQFPPPGAERVRWKDTQQEFDPRTLTGGAISPGGGVQTANTGATAFGVVGIATGIILLVMAMRERRKQ